MTSWELTIDRPTPGYFEARAAQLLRTSPAIFVSLRRPGRPGAELPAPSRARRQMALPLRAA